MMIITDDPKFLYELRECVLLAREENHVINDIKINNPVFVDASESTLAILPAIKRAKPICTTALGWNELSNLLLGNTEIIFVIDTQFFEVLLPKRTGEE